MNAFNELHIRIGLSAAGFHTGFDADTAELAAQMRIDRPAVAVHVVAFPTALDAVQAELNAAESVL